MSKITIVLQRYLLTHKLHPVISWALSECKVDKFLHIAPLRVLSGHRVIFTDHSYK